MRKKALITGITGQDGAYLSQLLLSKDYDVYGLVRRSSSDPFERIADMRLGHEIKLKSGNMRDLNAITRVMEEVAPDEVYNLAAQSHVKTSFECPEETWDVNYYGLGRIVNEAMKVNPSVKIYQASTSEMFGSAKPRQNEETPFSPVSPYAEAKLRAHEDYVLNYRKKGLFICSGILFNHESPLRGKQFVTRKITHSLSKIKLGKQDSFKLGNLNARRDWGYAGDYVQAMWLMLQQDKPDDFVIATGESRTVRDFVNSAAKALDMVINWEGDGEEEVGRDTNGKVIVSVDPSFYRPNELDYLEGDASKAKKILGWQPEHNFDQLVSMMVESDMDRISRGIYS